jgi:hypothetical protein
MSIHLGRSGAASADRLVTPAVLGSLHLSAGRHEISDAKPGHEFTLHPFRHLVDFCGADPARSTRYDSDLDRHFSLPRRAPRPDATPAYAKLPWACHTRVSEPVFSIVTAAITPTRSTR